MTDREIDEAQSWPIWNESAVQKWLRDMEIFAAYLNALDSGGELPSEAELNRIYMSHHQPSHDTIDWVLRSDPNNITSDAPPIIKLLIRLLDVRRIVMLRQYLEKRAYMGKRVDATLHRIPEDLQNMVLKETVIPAEHFLPKLGYPKRGKNKPIEVGQLRSFQKDWQKLAACEIPHHWSHETVAAVLNTTRRLLEEDSDLKNLSEDACRVEGLLGISKLRETMALQRLSSTIPPLFLSLNQISEFVARKREKISKARAQAGRKGGGKRRR